MAEQNAIRGGIYPCLFYNDAPAAMEWLCRAFGLQKRFAVTEADGSIAHAELTFGDGVIMVNSAKPEKGWGSPQGLAHLNGALCLYVTDPDAHHARAMTAGAEIVQPLKNEEYGARGYMAKDPEGNQWYFGDYVPGSYWERG